MVLGNSRYPFVVIGFHIAVGIPGIFLSDLMPALIPSLPGKQKLL
jgi:hypothetical protein